MSKKEGSEIKPWLEITVKIGCQNYCYFCPQKKLINAYSNRGPKYLSYQDFCTILKKIPKQIGLHFSGFCEPFFNPEASKMLKTAYNSGYDLELFTTLASLRQSDVKIIKNIKFKKFLIHVPDSKYFKYDTAKWLANLALIKGAQMHPKFITMGKINPKIKNAIGNLKPAHMVSRAGSLSNFSIERKIGRLTCPRFKCNVLLPNGDVYLCCMDYGLKHKLGNLLIDKYDDLFKSDGYRRVLGAANSENGDVICRYCEWAKGV